MEILIEDPYGIPENSIVSIRCGATRRQAPLEAAKAHPLKFPPFQEPCCEPLKIDVLQPVASARLVLHPKESKYRLSLDMDGNTSMAIGVNIHSGKNASQGTAGQLPPSPAVAPATVAPQPQTKYQDTAVSAREYLESHGLLRYVQALLHAVIQMRPKDPYKFMVDQLNAPRSAGSERPETPRTAMQDPNATQVIAAGMGQSFAPLTSPSPPQASPPPLKPCLPPSPQEAPIALPVRQGDSVLNGNSEAEESRLQMKALFEAGCKSGGLDYALANSLPGKDALGQKYEGLRGRLRTTLESGCTSGALGKALADVGKNDQGSSEDIDAMRTELMKRNMRCAQTECSASGTLERAPVHATAAASEPKSNNAACEELRLQMRNVLQRATDSGQLKDALVNLISQDSGVDDVKQSGIDVRNSQEASRNVESVDELRLRLRMLLESSTEKGNLQKALKALALEDEDQHTSDTLRHQMRTLLQNSCESGEMAAAFTKVLENSPDSPEVVRGKLQHVLETSCASGQLHHLVQSTAKLQLQTKHEDLKKDLRKALEQACKSGKLNEALEKQSYVVKTSAQDFLRLQTGQKNEQACESGSFPKASEMQASGKAAEVHEVKERMRTLLQTAYDTGQLTAALELAFPPQSDHAEQQKIQSVNAIKTRMKYLLETKCASGQLLVALGNVQKAKLDAQQIDQHNVESTHALKSSMRNLEETKCALGEVEVASDVVPKGRPNTQPLHDLKMSMRGMLENAVCSGELTKALSTLAELNQEVPLGPSGNCVPSAREPMPPALAKPPGLPRPMSAAVTRADPPAVMQEVLQKQVRPLSAVSSQKWDCLSNDVFRVREDQQSLHRVVDHLSKQMEQLQRENRSLMERLRKSHPDRG